MLFRSTMILSSVINGLARKELIDAKDAQEQAYQHTLNALGTIEKTTNVVSENANGVIQKTVELRTSMHQVTSAIEQIAQGTSTQAANTQQGVVYVVELGNILDINQQNIVQLEAANTLLKEVRNQGQIILKDVKDKTEKGKIGRAHV